MLRRVVQEYITSKISPEQVFIDEPMKNHTTFKVGGEADALIRIKAPEELVTLVSYFDKVEQPYFIKGNGSNILVSDKGYRGVILEIADGFNDIRVDGDTITAQAGALMGSIARVAMENGLTGMEFASGIPGTIGGGVVMNAGAYNGELKDVVSSVTVMNNAGERITLNNDNMKFGYRYSVVKDRPFVVLSVTIKLKNGDKDTIKNTMDDLNRRRREKQPLEFPSAGSTFKRPEGYFAGKLIMEAGLRGYSLGGAAVSNKHCGFVINTGTACAADIYELIIEIQERVYSRFRVRLEPEIIFLGFD